MRYNAGDEAALESIAADILNLDDPIAKIKEQDKKERLEKSKTIR